MISKGQKVSERELKTGLDFAKIAFFIDKARFNHYRIRSFGRSIKGIPVKIVVPKARGVSFTIFEVSVVDISLKDHS